jgi:hypothetical protein
LINTIYQLRSVACNARSSCAAGGESEIEGGSAEGTAGENTLTARDDRQEWADLGSVD